MPYMYDNVNPGLILINATRLSNVPSMLQFYQNDCRSYVPALDFKVLTHSDSCQLHVKSALLYVKRQNHLIFC